MSDLETLKAQRGFMQRYGDDGFDNIEERNDGEFVAYEDAAALLALVQQHEAEIAALKQTAFNIGADAGGYLDKIAALKASIASLEAKNAELRKPETNPEWVILAEDHKRLEAQLAAQEAEIAELKRQVSEAHGECSEDMGKLHEELSAERSAHEATKKALEEADRALLFWRGYTEYVFSSDMEDGEPKRAVKSALAREQARRELKEK